MGGVGRETGLLVVALLLGLGLAALLVGLGLLALLCVGLALGLGGLTALLGCGHCDDCKVVRMMMSMNVYLGLVRKGIVLRAET